MLDSFLYQYLVGGLVFAFGIGCGLKTGVFSLSNPHGRKRLVLLCLGFVFFMALHGALVVWGK